MVRLGFILIFFFAASSCNEFQQAVRDAKKDIPPPQKDNFIVLLDLSDRILVNNQEQVSKDLTVVKAIFSLFKENLNKKDPTHLYYALNDKLKVLVAPQKTTPAKIYETAGQLRIELASEHPEKKAAVVDQGEKTFNLVLPDLYKQALISKRTADYTGADIWKYFEEDLTGDLDADAQNTLFIITDGYLDFEKTEERPVVNNRFTSCAQIIQNLKASPDWSTRFDKEDFGLLPIGKKFRNLKIILMQINPAQEWPGEYNMLTRIWSKWFKEMRVDSFSFIKDENINEVKESMEKFMHVKMTEKIQPSLWTAISLPDSNVLALNRQAAGILPKGIAENISAELSTKKKDNGAAGNTNEKPIKKKGSLRRSINKDEQLTFGPAY